MTGFKNHFLALRDHVLDPSADHLPRLLHVPIGNMQLADHRVVVSEHFKKGFVSFNEHAFAIQNVDAVAGGFQDCPQTDMLPFRQTLNALALGNVATDTVDVLPVLNVDDGERHLGNKFRSVGLAENPLETMQPLFLGDRRHASGLGPGVFTVGLIGW